MELTIERISLIVITSDKPFTNIVFLIEATGIGGGDNGERTSTIKHILIGFGPK